MKTDEIVDMKMHVRVFHLYHNTWVKSIINSLKLMKNCVCNNRIATTTYCGSSYEHKSSIIQHICYLKIKNYKKQREIIIRSRGYHLGEKGKMEEVKSFTSILKESHFFINREITI